MTEELETLVLKIRADTTALARDTADMKARFEADAVDMGKALRRSLDGAVLKTGAESAMRATEVALDRLIRKGKLGLDELKQLLLDILADVAKAALREGLGAIFGRQRNGGSGSSDWVGLIAQGVQLLGMSGRASGGPVTEGRAYLVGERGPEMFVPERAGRIEPLTGSTGARVFNISINVAAPDSASPQLMQRSAQQVARAVRRAVGDG
ncbi:tail tape measure protein [Pedomonas mirosovicensis]|uniref:tail tape measure protein n=1 Tax=Pedomonas mirosovicensis TaxID=2908641 RepID=UPI002166C916|nr:tail tape measure protein [Pedomonas mirosovicensis]MCH8684862.1 tail tape measure protein [Pedomonas mirosovicensis]